MNKYNNEKMLNVSELAKSLKIGRNTAYRLIHTTGFPAITIGNRILIPKQQLDCWITEQIKNKELNK